MNRTRQDVDQVYDKDGNLVQSVPITRADILTAAEYRALRDRLYTMSNGSNANLRDLADFLLAISPEILPT